MNNLPSISPELLAKYQTEIGRLNSPATASRKNSSLKHFFSWAQKEGHLQENPFMTSQPSAVIPSVVEESLAKLVAIFSLIASGLAVILLAVLLSTRLPIGKSSVFVALKGLAQIESNSVAQPFPASTPTPLPLNPSPPPQPAVSSDPLHQSFSEASTISTKIIKGIGGALSIITEPLSDGDITLAPDGTGSVNIRSSTTSQDTLNISNANLTTGNLISGYVGNNLTSFQSERIHLLYLSSGSTPTERFSVDGEGNTYVAGEITSSGVSTKQIALSGDLKIGGVTRFNSLGRLASITGYYQDSGLFEIDQGSPDSSRITKHPTLQQGPSTADVLTLTLNESNTTASNYDTLVLERKNAGSTGYALDVRSGNANFAADVTVGGVLTSTGNISGANITATGNLTATGASSLQAAATLSSTLSVSGATTLSSTLSVSGQTTLAAATIAGQATATRAPTSAHTGTWAIDSSTWNVSNSTVYINPASATADSNLLGLAVDGGVKFAVDAEGDIYGRNLILTGSTTSGSQTIAGDLIVEGNTTLGDATTDTFTINPATLTWAGGDKTIDITGSTTRTLNLLNSTASQVANLNLSDGSLYTGGAIRISNSGAGTFTTGDFSSTLTANGSFTLGDSGDTGSIATSDWGITTTGVVTGIGTIGTDGDITITKTDPALILNSSTTTDTDFWIATNNDGDGVDDDLFQIGDGTTPGTNPFLTIDTSGNVGIGITSPAGILHVAGQCVAAGTRIRRRRKKKNGAWEEDDIPVEDIKPEDEVLSLNDKTGEFEWHKVEKTMDMGIQEVVSLTISSGKRILTTANHPYLVIDKPLITQGTFEIDQSIRIEDLGKPTTIGIALGEKLFASSLPQNNKKQIVKMYQKINKVHLFGPRTFAQAITETFKALKMYPARLIIDTEYTGYEAPIRDEIKLWFPETDVIFHPIGKKSLAHEAAIRVHRGKREADVKLETALKPKEKGSGLKALRAVSPRTGYRGSPRPQSQILCPSYYTNRDLSRAVWKKVQSLQLGQYIATVDGWEKITGIQIIKRLRTYDLQIEGTHNFVGNEIVAHNTSIFGAGEGGTPTTTTIRGAAASGTNVSGANLTFDASNGTGTGGSGSIIFRTAPAGTTGSTANTLTEIMRIAPNGNVGIGTTSPAAYNLQVAGNIGPNVAPALTSITQTATAIDTSASGYPSVAIGTDGLPVIAYYDGGTGALSVYKCSNTSCSSGSSAAVDSGQSAGQYASITIGSDGLPVISYYDGTNFNLKFVKCGNASCSSGNTTNTLDSTGDVGIQSSIAIGTDGFPVISYNDTTNGDLKVIKCADRACTPASNTTNSVDTASDTGYQTSIVIGTDGYPVISYLDGANGDLKVAKCADSSCTPGSATISTPDTADGSNSSMTIGKDGLPVISYFASGIKVYKCSNASCASGSSNAIDGTVTTNTSTSIAIGTDGLPFVAYDFAGATGDLKVVKCGNASCSSGNTTTNVESTNRVGMNLSMVIGTDSLPIIVHYDFTNADIRALKCATANCATTTGSQMAGGYSLGGSLPNPRSYSSPFQTINTLQISNPTTFQNLSFSTAGSEKLTITPSGTIGIGTTSPSYTLDVAGTVNTSTVYAIGGSTVLHNTGTRNQFLGVSAGNLTLTGTDNVALGYNAGNALTSGANNVFAGSGAGAVNTASGNSFFGYASGDSITSGTGNAFFGYNTGQALTTQVNNTIFGYAAGSGASFASSHNVLLGYNTGLALTSGASNVFIGSGAGDVATTGTGTVLIGYDAGGALTTGTANTLIGYQTGKVLTTQTNNTIMGYNAGSGASFASSDNSLFGNSVGQAITTGAQNTFVGSNAGLLNSSGAGNVFLGYLSGTNIETGSYNTFLGTSTDPGFDPISSSIAIGYATAVTASNQLVIGANNANGYITDGYLGRGVTTATPTTFSLHSSGGSTVGTVGSDFKLIGGAGSTATTGAAGGSIYLLGGDAGGSGNNNGGNVYVYGGAKTGSGTAGNTLLAVNSSGTIVGNVGIGTTTPGGRLDIAGTTDSFGLKLSQASTAITTAANTLLNISSATADTSNHLVLIENTSATSNYGNGGSDSGIVKIISSSTGTVGTTTTNPNVAGLFVTTTDSDTITTLIRNSSTTITMANVGTAGAQGDPGILTIEGESANTSLYNLITAYGGSTTRSDAAAVFRVRADGVVYGESAFTSSGADYAEYFPTDDTSLEAGDLVSVSSLQRQGSKNISIDSVSTAGMTEGGVAKSSSAYDKKLLGVISDNPSVVGNAAGGRHENDPRYKLVGLLGQVSVKVSTENGPIGKGDFLTSSSVSGVAMKATKPGQVIGKALKSWSGEGGTECSIQPKTASEETAVGGSEPIRGSDLSSTSTISQDGADVNTSLGSGPEGNRTPGTQLDRSAPNQSVPTPATLCGKILTFVNVSWHDPDVYLTDTGDVKIVNNVIPSIPFVIPSEVEGSLANASSSGSNKSRDSSPFDKLRTQNNKFSLADTAGNVVTRIGQFSEAVIADLQTGIIVTTQLVADTITTKELHAGKVVSPLVVADRVETQTLTAQKAQIEEATISGTLTATKIQTEDIQSSVIDKLKDRLDLLASQMEQANAQSATYKQVEKILDDSATGSATLAEASASWTTGCHPAPSVIPAEAGTHTNVIPAEAGIYTDRSPIESGMTSGGAGMTGGGCATDINVTNDLNVLGDVNVFGTTRLASTYVSGDLTITSQQANSVTSLALSTNTISVFGGALQIIASDGIDIMNGALVVDSSGNVKINGNLAVSGEVQASKVTSQQVSTDSLEATGSATLRKLVIAAQQNVATPSAQIANNEVNSNSTAGQAIMPAGATSLVINNPNVTDNTLIYVTPQSSTNNQTLYVLNKVSGAYFTVAIDRPTPYDIKFNWWIIDLKQ